jgi:hypothetical protein
MSNPSPGTGKIAYLVHTKLAGSKEDKIIANKLIFNWLLQGRKFFTR